MSARLSQQFAANMKARIEESREAIKVDETVEAVQDTTQRLRRHLNRASIMDEKERKAATMDKTDIAAAMTLFTGAKLLLAKTMPDLKLMELELSGPGGGPIPVVTRVELVPMLNGNSPNPTSAETDTGL